MGARVRAVETTIGNDNCNGLCGPPPGGIVTTIINGYFAVLTAQTTDKEIELFDFVCGLFDYPPNGDNVSSVGDNGFGICDNGFNRYECEFGAVFTALQQLEKE